MRTHYRVLIIEEQTLLALDIESVLAERSPIEVTHFRRLADAPNLANLPVFDLAIVEARLGASEVVAYTGRISGGRHPHSGYVG